jgi:hypothetical protein
MGARYFKENTSMAAKLRSTKPLFISTRRLSFEQLGDRRLLSGDGFGPEYFANSTTVGEQLTGDLPANSSSPLPDWQSAEKSITTDAAGNTVVVWSDKGNIVGQRFDFSGNRIGGEFPISARSRAIGTNRNAVVASDAAGELVVVWESTAYESAGIYMRRFNRFGHATSVEEILIAAGGSQPSVARAANGNVAIAYASSATNRGTEGQLTGSAIVSPSFPSEIFLELIRYDGARLVGPLRVNDDLTGAQVLPRVAINDDYVVVTWTSYRQEYTAGAARIFGQRYTAIGQKLGPNFQVSYSPTQFQVQSSVGIDGTGNFVVAWQDFFVRYSADGKNYGDRDVLFQRFAANGARLGGEELAHRRDIIPVGYVGRHQYQPSVAVHTNGNFAIAWSTLDSQFPPVYGDGDYEDGVGVRVQRFLANGTRNGEQLRLNEAPTGDQQFSSIVMHGEGSFSAAWSSNGSYHDTSGYGVVVRHFQDALPGPCALDADHYLIEQLTGDFNGDGKEDIAYQRSTTGNWCVSLSTGHDFRTAPWGVASPAWGWTSLVGDFNGDGRDDIAGYHISDGSIWVHASSGMNSFFTNRWGGPVSPRTDWTWLVGDFNGDGRDDLAGYHPSDGSLWVNLSMGNNSFSSSQWGGPVSPRTNWTWLVGDFNGDSRDDLAGYHPSDGTIWVNASTGTNSFRSTRWAGPVSPTTDWTWLVGDFNGDQLDDLTGYHPSDGTLWVLLAANGTFHSRQWAGPFSPTTDWSFTIGDFTGDDVSDLAGYHPSDGTVWISRSNGSQFVTFLQADLSPSTGWILRVGDFNGDGMDDMSEFFAADGSLWVSQSHGAGAWTSRWETLTSSPALAATTPMTNALSDSMNLIRAQLAAFVHQLWGSASTSGSQYDANGDGRTTLADIVPFMRTRTPPPIVRPSVAAPYAATDAAVDIMMNDVPSLTVRPSGIRRQAGAIRKPSGIFDQIDHVSLVGGTDKPRVRGRHRVVQR